MIVDIMFKLFICIYFLCVHLDVWCVVLYICICICVGIYLYLILHICVDLRTYLIITSIAHCFTAMYGRFLGYTTQILLSHICVISHLLFCILICLSVSSLDICIYLTWDSLRALVLINEQPFSSSFALYISLSMSLPSQRCLHNSANWNPNYIQLQIIAKMLIKYFYHFY